VLAMVNLMPKSLVEGRFLDAGISMVTDQVLPQQQQQQQTYSSLLPAERFVEVLGNSPSVVSFVAFASKYVFLCFAFLCKLIACVIDALGRFSLPFHAYVFLREEDVNVFFASSSGSSTTLCFFFPQSGIRQKPSARLPTCLWNAGNSHPAASYGGPISKSEIQPSFLAVCS
jgi:hypothetical protein